MTTTDERPMPDRAERLVPDPLLWLLTFVLVLAGALLLREVSSLVVPVLFGLFLGLATWPLVGALESRGVRHGLAVAIAMIAILVGLLVTIGVIAFSVGELVVRVPRYQDRLAEEIDSLQALLAQVGIAVDPDALPSVISPDQIASVVRPVASAVSGAGVAILVLVVTMVYALAGGISLHERAVIAFGEDHALLAGIRQFGTDLRRFFMVRALLGVFAAVLTFILLVVLGVPLPALWSFLVFAASFIPNVGVIIAVIPPAILALLDNGAAAAVAIIVGYTLINFAQDNVLQPVVLGSEVNLSPLVTFVGVVAWTWMLGAAGALLAVPLTVGLVALLEVFPSTQAIATLMRNRPQSSEEFIEPA